MPAGRFRPSHCPNRRCRFYRPHRDWQYFHWGFYKSPAWSRPIPRFQCQACRRTFTARTFAATYWLHRWDLFALITRLSVAGGGVRQIARSLDVSHSTVARHLTRAGRLCLLFHRQMLADHHLNESIAFDGFETFEHSQFFPYHLNLAAGRDSWFLYHFTDSHLRRKGAMTAPQKARRSELEAALGRPDPKAVENGVRELIQTVLRLARDTTTAIELHSDEHPAYPRAIRRLRRRPGTPPLRHFRTPSTEPRTRANALFPVNLADLLLRHCQAGHRRETIAFDKRRQGGVERAAIFLVWRNAIKWQRERNPGVTAAMRAGILPRRLDWRDVFARRLFPRRSELPGCWWGYYWRRIKTAALENNQTENRAVFAF